MLTTGARLPSMTVRDEVTGRIFGLRVIRRESVALALLHPPGCAACDAYRRALADALAAFADWDGRAVVTTGTAEVADALDVTIPAVIIADRYGQVYHVATAEDADGLLDARELEEWLRFLGTQCPE